MSECCKKCIKLLCPNRDTKEGCKDCVSEVYWEMQKIDKKLEIKGE